MAKADKTERPKNIKINFGILKILILSNVAGKLWGPSALAKYLIDRPSLLPKKHRTKSYNELFSLLNQHYNQLEKAQCIRKIGYATYELDENFKGETLKFVSQSELSVESKKYLPHNKRLIFRVVSMNQSILKDWKKIPLRGWIKYQYENDKIVAELVPAHKIFDIPNVKGVIIRLKKPKWFTIVKTEEDVEEVNNLYDSQIIHESNELMKNFGFMELDIDVSNPKEILQDGEIHDVFTEKLPDKIHFTDTVVKYNSSYGGKPGNKKMEFKTAADVKDYVRESVSRERLDKIREIMPELADAIYALANADQFLAENINVHIPFVIEGTNAAKETAKASLETRKAVKKLPNAVAKAVEKAMEKAMKQFMKSNRR